MPDKDYENCKKVERFYASAVAVYTDSVSPSSVDHWCAVVVVVVVYLFTNITSKYSYGKTENEVTEYNNVDLQVSE